MPNAHIPSQQVSLREVLPRCLVSGPCRGSHMDSTEEAEGAKKVYGLVRLNLWSQAVENRVVRTNSGHSTAASTFPLFLFRK